MRAKGFDDTYYRITGYVHRHNILSSDAVQAIQSFRSKLSVRWFRQFDPHEVESRMSHVWLTLFSLSQDSDSAVRLSAYSAIGGLLLTLTPFIPTIIRKSFAAALDPMATKASVAVLVSFLYICHLTSPSDLEDFILSVNVLPHFGADLSNFINFLPKFIPLMSSPTLQFHQLLLRSLLCSFAHSPTHGFVACAVSLIALNPAPLAGDLIEFIQFNSLHGLLLAFGPQLLANPQVRVVLKPDWVELFAEEALRVLGDATATLGDFELACGTLAILSHTLSERIRRRMLPSYPRHFKRLLLQLPSDFDAMEVQEDDPSSVQVAKLKALARHLHAVDDLEVRRKVLGIFAGWVDARGDVFTALVDAIRERFDIVFGLEKNLLSTLLRGILEAKSRIRVQGSAILSLLSTIGPERGRQLITDFEGVVVRHALEYAASSRDELVTAALNCLSTYANNGNIEEIINCLWKLDVIDATCASRFLRVLHTLLDVVGPNHFDQMASLVCDIIMFNGNDWQIAGNGFHFLRRIKYFQAPQELTNSCIDWIVRMYKALTQYNSMVASPIKLEPLPAIITWVETDIVASDTMDVQSQIRALLHCYQYLVESAKEPTPENAAFTRELVTLFPEAVIPGSRRLVSAEYSAYCRSVASILRTETSHVTTSICCNFLADAPLEFREGTAKTVEFMLNNPKVTSCSSLFSFFRYLTLLRPTEAAKYREKIEMKLDEVNLVLFKIKLNEFTADDFDRFAAQFSFQQFPLADSSFVEFLKRRMLSLRF
jgi:hypothetical protein